MALNSALLGRRGEESVEVWFSRVRKHVPLMPFGIAKQWIYRHWDPDCQDWSPYGELIVSTMSFVKVSMCTDEILGISDLTGSDPDGQICMIGDWLANYMQNDGGWPVPIVVLDNRQPSVEVVEFGHEEFGPIHLLEGHRRLSFFRQLSGAKKPGMECDVWFASFPLDPSACQGSWKPRDPHSIGSSSRSSLLSPILKITNIGFVPREILDEINDEELNSIKNDSELVDLFEKIRLRLIKDDM